MPKVYKGQQIGADPFSLYTIFWNVIENMA